MAGIGCVRSGHCCHQGPCLMGEWGTTPDGRGGCKYLELAHIEGDAKFYQCGKAEEITEADRIDLPMFGNGCCQPMFNTERLTNIEAMMQNRALQQFKGGVVDYEEGAE